jgi:hypothetical protein
VWADSAVPSRAHYRAGQFLRSIGARPDEPALHRVRCRLNTAQWSLFEAMAPRDQWHAIETVRLLSEGGHDDPELELAALLHDAGKGYIRLHERVVYVLLSSVPRLLRRVATPGERGWRCAMRRSLLHAETGAELALATGASERVAWLIRMHHHPDPDDTQLLALLAADERA